MTVTFDELQHFLDDLTAERADNPDCVDDGILRIVIEELQLNKTASQYKVIAGWSCISDLRQLVLECGTDFGGNAEPKAKQLAEATQKQINEFCQSNGIKVRGGRFHGE